MPRFHAGYSIGTVAGALVGAAMVGLHVPVTVHLLVVGVMVAIAVPVAVRRFIADIDESDAGHEAASETGRIGAVLARWREPRTLLVGVVVLAFAFAEGAGVDWINLSLIDGYHQAAELGTLGFAVFLAAMRSSAARPCWPSPACCCSSSALSPRWRSSVCCSGDSAPPWAFRLA
jgi:hypothetical protein